MVEVEGGNVKDKIVQVELFFTPNLESRQLPPSVRKDLITRPSP
jgi:hypothetical protein